jgi:hypothetical protein
MKVKCPDCGGKFQQKGLGVHRARFCPATKRLQQQLTDSINKVESVPVRRILDNRLMIHWHCPACESGGHFTLSPDAPISTALQAMVTMHEVNTVCSGSPELGKAS